jgi:hypothetical protein
VSTADKKYKEAIVSMKYTQQVVQETMDSQGISWNQRKINKVLNRIQFREMNKTTKVN